MATVARVRVRKREARDEPVNAIARTCAELGPWNVVALAEPLGPRHALSLRQLFDTVHGATGIVVAGRRADCGQGPVVVAMESIDRLPGMLRAAERLAAVSRSEVRLVIVQDEARELEWMESQARLALAESPRIQLEPSRPARSTAEVAERLRQLGAGFIIAQFGGLVVPDGGDLRPLSTSLRCPLLLVR